MVAPTLPHLSPEQRERLERLVSASRLRAALYPSPKPPPVRRRSRSRQYPTPPLPPRGSMGEIYRELPESAPVLPNSPNTPAS